MRHAPPIVVRIFKNFSAHVYGQLVIAFIQLAGVPILLHFWGVRLYGEWLILCAIPAYLSMTDLGFAQSAANDMTQRMGRSDREGALVVFQSIGVLIGICSIVGLILVIVVLTTTPFSSWLPLHALSQKEAAWVLGLLAAEVLVKLNEGTLHAGYRANGGNALHWSIYYSTLLVQYLGLWLMAMTGHGPVAAAGVFLGVRLVVTPAVALLLLWLYPWLPIGVSHSRWVEVRKLTKPALANLAFPLAQGLNIQGMVLVVGAVLGPIAVVTFATLRTLTRLALQAVLTISHATEPEFAHVFGIGDIVLLRRLYIHTTRIALALAVALAIGLYFFGGWILRLWTHGKVTMDAPLFAWLLASAVAGTLWYSGLTLLKAANRHLRAAVVFVFAAALAVALAYALMKFSGNLPYAGLALLCMDVLMIIYVLPAASRFCGGTTISILRQLLNPFSIMHGRSQ